MSANEYYYYYTLQGLVASGVWVDAYGRQYIRYVDACTYRIIKYHTTSNSSSHLDGNTSHYMKTKNVESSTFNDVEGSTYMKLNDVESSTSSNLIR